MLGTTHSFGLQTPVLNESGVVTVGLQVGVRLTQHAGWEHRALCCLTPVNASICSNVWPSTCRVLLWSEGATEARLLQRDSQVSSHTWGDKDFYSEEGKGETRTEEIICDAATPRLLAVRILRQLHTIRTWNNLINLYLSAHTIINK